jgi:hypothetical protein
MASQLKVDTITGVTTAGSIAVTGEGNSTTTNLQQGLAKSWVKFDGSVSTPAALDSLNSASITDSGTGTYINNLTNAMANINYCMSTAGEHDSGSHASIGEYNHDSANTTTASKVDYHNTSGGAVDVGNAGQVVHGDLA